MKRLWAMLALLALAAHARDDSRQHARVELGRRLFYDADLSADGTMACATCHEQHHAFAEGNATHGGVTGEAGRRNVPGLANVGRFHRLTWADPRQTTLAMQVSVPVLGTHPVEMGMAGRQDEIERRLAADPCYRAMFAQAFGDGVTYAHIARALAAFEATLVSRSSPYDRGEAPRAGQAAFRQHCAACHKGVDFTDQRYHALGPAGARDEGLYEITGKPTDKGAFRTPSLRNLAATAPY